MEVGVWDFEKKIEEHYTVANGSKHDAVVVRSKPHPPWSRGEGKSAVTFGECYLIQVAF